MDNTHMHHPNRHRCSPHRPSSGRPLSDEQFAQSSLALVARWRVVLWGGVATAVSDRLPEPYAVGRLLSASSEQPMAMPTTATAVGPSAS